MKLSRAVELFQWVVILGMFALAAAVWSRVPEQIPVHWNLQGGPNGYGSKLVGLLLAPIMAIGLYLLLLFLPRIDPGYANYRNFSGAYNILRVSILLFLAGIYTAAVAAALGYLVNMNAVAGLGMGLLMVVMGNLMGKIRPNWFVGVRTPWTLSSKLSWTKTHRLAGWLFMALGPLFAVWGLTGSAWLFSLAIVSAAVGCVWLVVYSYLVYRDDPERMTPAGTSPSAE